MKPFSITGDNRKVYTGRGAAAKVSLSARSHIEDLDAGLISVTGTSYHYSSSIPTYNTDNFELSQVHER